MDACAAEERTYVTEQTGCAINAYGGSDIELPRACGSEWKNPPEIQQEPKEKLYAFKRKKANALLVGLVPRKPGLQRLERR